MVFGDDRFPRDHKGQRSSIDRFSLRKWCKPTALYSNLRMSLLYVDLHDA